MKKSISLIAFLCVFGVAALPVLAMDNNNESRIHPSITGIREKINKVHVNISGVKEQIQNKKSETLQNRAQKELDRRIESLNKLINRINEFKKISAEQKSALAAQIQTEINALTGLQAKIKLDTDPIALKTDVQSIMSGYRVYALFIPQIQIIASADRMLTTADDLTIIYDKLKSRASGGDSSLQTLLADMQTKITDAKTQAQNAMNAVIPLTPEGYPGNKTILENARKTLQTGQQDLVTARDDAKQIVKGLHTIKTTVSPAPSSTTE
jgi:hypothetical protein